MPFPLFVLAGSAIAIATMAATLLLSRSRWRRFSAFAAVVGAAGLVLLTGPGHFDYYADDAYITLRYSQHLADGLGPNWNSVGRVEGYTSFLWMAVLAGVARLGFDLVTASATLGFLSVIATFYFVFRIWQLWADPDAPTGIKSPALLAAVLLGLAFTAGVSYWGFSGLETPLFMALLTASAYLYFRERRRPQLPWSAVALAAAAMTRPEGLIVVAVTGAFMMVAVLQSVDQPRALRRYLLWAAVFLLIYGSYFIWRYYYYGYLLPNTFYAKVGPTYALFDRGLDYIWLHGLRYQLLAMLGGIAILLATPRIRHDAAYIAVLSTVMLAGVVFEGGDAFDYGRFIVPLLPLMYLGGLAGLATLLTRLDLDPARVALIASVILAIGGLSLLRGAQEPPLLPGERAALQERKLLGTWLSDNAPADYTVAAYAVGALGYYTDRDILDMLGINDVTIAHTDVPDFGSGLAGHEKYNVDYVLERIRPEIIITNDASEQPVIEELLRRRFAEDTPVQARDELLTDPRLWERYEVRSLNIDGRWFNFLQREDTVAELQGPGLLPP